MNWQASVERTVTALGYEVVDCERSSQGLLRVFIDRVPGRTYPGDAPAGAPGTAPEGEASGAGAVHHAADSAVTVDDCERVTRQLQYALEVDGCDYKRLEVSSPGLDRPLRKPADYLRFADAEVDLTLRQPLQGRRKFRGTLRVGPAGGGAAGATPAEAALEYALEFKDGKDEKVLGFALHEVREARLVPVLDFKGRRRGAAKAPAQVSGGHEQ